MWKHLHVLTTLFVIVRGVEFVFDFVEFQRKYCHDEKNVKTTAFYSPHDTGHPKTVDQAYVCEGFILTSQDLDYMALKHYVFSNKTNVLLRDCEIEYFNEYLVSLFPKIHWLYFDNCEISLKNPEIIANSSISKNFWTLGFHKCKITKNLKNSSALHKFSQLAFVYIDDTKFEHPVLDRHFLPPKHDMMDLIIHKTNLEGLQKGLLSNCSHSFKRLISTNCKLKEIDTLLYKMRCDIENVVSFANNMITKIPTSLGNLQIFKNLLFLKLSDNTIVEPILQRDHFKSLKNLRFLDLARNTNISEIGYLTFQDTQLEHLDMSRVNLKTLNKLGNTKWNKIIFSNNQIEEIGSHVFEDLVNLEFLYLDNNKISNLKQPVFRNLFNLRELRLNDNKLQNLTRFIFSNSEKLEVLDLSNNLIFDTGNSLFAAYNSLKELYLQNNKIKMINSIDQYPISLIRLDISNNPIEDLTNWTFYRLEQLIYLDMSNTDTSFEDNIFEPLHALRTLIMEGNQIENIDDMFFPRRLENLYLGSNKISKISDDKFEGLVNLQYLDISNNKKLRTSFPKIRYVKYS